MSFLDLMKDTQDNYSVTENGMRGYKTTYNPIVDVNFKVASYRHEADNVLTEDFKKILMSDNADHALRFLFYIRDARAGIGERRLFRNWLKVLANTSFANKDEIMNKVITEWIPFYGRYDDMFVLMGTKYEDVVVEFVRNQLRQDFINMNKGKSVSLLAKWMPSENASNKDTIKLARQLANKLGASAAEYRKTLSALRSYLKVLETMLSANEWNKVDYNAVPSKANLKYKDAFLKHDEERRRDYLAKLRVGDSTVKMNGGVNFPHEIVHSYCEGYWNMEVKCYDEALEQLWKALKDVDGLDNTIVVRDGSGSMTSRIGNGNTTALDVSSALAIYCAERLKGDFKNKFMTFSSKAEVVDLTNCNSLHTKLQKLEKYDDCSNTNIANVFDTILETAVDHHLSPDQVPARVLIISDMEFDGGWSGFNADSNVFVNASKVFERAGYKLPKLIFWNVNSRTNTIPCKENENGVILVSGFSQNVLDLVMSGKTDPKDALYDELDKKYGDIPLLEVVKATASNKRVRKEFAPSFL